MRSKHLFLAAIVVCLWTGEARLSACSCAGPTVPCQAAWQAHAVFSAMVIGISDRQPSADHVLFAQRAVWLAVTEVFRGEVTKSVTIYTGRGGGDCGYAFEIGKAYLVYAHKVPTGELTTGICSRTQPLSAAGGDLDYLRGPAAQPSRLGTIHGVATYPDPRQEYPNPSRVAPYAGATVTIEAADPGRRDRYETTTDADGKYSMKVPVGRYTATLAVRDGLYSTGGFMRPEILDGRGCSEVDFVVKPDGRIGGRVVASDGRPVSGLSIEVLRAAAASDSYFSRLQRVLTDNAGNFEFSRLATGKYVVGLTLSRNGPKGESNAIWLGGLTDSSPRPVSIEPEERAALGDLQLPASVGLASVEGVVTTADGKPAAGAKVYVLSSPNFGIAAGPLAVDQNGRFSFAVIAGRSYRVSAELAGAPDARLLRRAESQPFVAAAGAARTVNLEIH